MQTTLELTSTDRPGFKATNGINTPNAHFRAKFPGHTEQFGAAFLELREDLGLGKTKISPISINLDFFASILSDPGIGLSVVYFEPDMQFYYKSPFETVYRPVSPEKLQNLYRGFLIRCAEQCLGEVNILNLFHEFRQERVARQVTNRAKSVLAADQSFFSPTSPNSREKGIELHERIARRFVDEMLTSEPGQVLKLADAYEVFRGLLKKRGLADIKRSDFKAVVGPMITSNFNVALRNDLAEDGKSGVRGWKNVRLLQSGPG